MSCVERELNLSIVPKVLVYLMLKDLETTLCLQKPEAVILIGRLRGVCSLGFDVTQQRTYRERKGRTDTRRFRHNNRNQCSHFDTDRYSY